MANMILRMARRRWAIGMISIAALAILFLAPVVPAKGVSYADSSSIGTGPSVVPPVSWGILTDPSGTYWFHFFTNGTYAMNLTSYEQLLNDPYSTHPSNCPHTIEGNIILISCPQTQITINPGGPPVASGSTTSPVPPGTNGFESPAYWLAGQGAIYFNGRYLWR